MKSNQLKTRASIGTSAIVNLQKEFADNAINMRGFQMESFGTADDTRSASVISTLKSALRSGGFQGFASKKTKVVMPGDHLRPIRMEDAAEPGSATEGTQNEEIFLTEAQEKAGIHAAAMADEPAEWAKKAIEATNEASNHVNNTEEGVEFAERVKLEAYDDSNFRDAVGYSVVWNIVAARQSNAVENIWTTMTLDPQQSHIEAMVQFQVFHQEVRHKSSGDEVKFGRILMLETIIDGSLLDENIIKCVPVYEATVSEEHFADPADIAPRTVTVDGEEVLTAPLRVDMVHGLLGLSQAAIGGLTGELNSASQLAPMPRMENLYIRVTSKAGKESLIKINAASLPRNSFTAMNEGNIRDIQLKMIVNQLSLDAETVDITGAPAEALDFLRQSQYLNHRVEFQLKVNGDSNLENGNTEIQSAKGRVTAVKIRQNLGHFALEKDETILNDIKDKITSIKLEYFDIDASRTNIDRRQRGPLTNVTAEFQKYYVRLGSPISTIFPATEATSNVDLIAPMTQTRIKNDYYGIKALFRYAELLAGTAMSYEADAARVEMKAIGAHIIRPYYKHLTISMLDILDSNRSKNKLEDLQHAFLNYIRDHIIHGMRDSGYELALRVQSGSAEAVPTLAMITNQVFGKYLFQLGDTRILGSLPYPVVADTHASNLLGVYGSDEHELFIVPKLPGSQADPLDFGYHLWKPELASTLQVTRDNSTNREIVVQPCNDWHMFCPFMIRVTITDVTAAMTTKTPLAILV